MSEAKRRIRQNVWGNWNGYEGNCKVIEFGTGEFEANEWLQGVEREPFTGPITMRKFDFESTESATKSDEQPNDHHHHHYHPHPLPSPPQPAGD